MQYHQNAKHAINQASHDPVNFCVGYCQGKGWHTYNPGNGCPEGSVPEFACAPGRIPFPLSKTAIDVWFSILEELRK